MVSARILVKEHVRASGPERHHLSAALFCLFLLVGRSAQGPLPLIYPDKIESNPIAPKIEYLTAGYSLNRIEA
jgi:hypothetical protein